MKKIFLILILIISFSAKAQDIIDFLPENESNSHSLFLSGMGVANSSALTTEFIGEWVNSGFITEDIKEASIKRMRKNNYAGVNLSGKAYYINDNFIKKTNKNTLSFFAGYESNYILSVKFSEDLFRLAFSGNKYFEDKTAFIDNNKFTFLAWDKIGGGIFKRFSHQNGSSLKGLALNFVRVRQYNMIEVKSAELYTAPYGEYIDVQASFNSKLSDTSIVPNFGTFNGYGISTDFFYKYSSKKNINYYFSVNNLGLVRMNNNSMSINHDTSFNFNGIAINEIIQNGSMMWSIGSTDSIIESYIPTYNDGSYSIKTPCTLRAGIELKTTSKLSINMDINHILFIPYIPKINLKTNYFIRENFRISPSVSYGGFNKGNAGLEFGFNNKKMNIIAGSNDINGLISPKNSSGISAYIGILIILNNDI